MGILKSKKAFETPKTCIILHVFFAKCVTININVQGMNIDAQRSLEEITNALPFISIEN